MNEKNQESTKENAKKRWHDKRMQHEKKRAGGCHKEKREKISHGKKKRMSHEILVK